MGGGHDRPYRIVFGTSGWRGEYGRDFVRGNVRRAAQGVAEYYRCQIRHGAILIGFDPRRDNAAFAMDTAALLAVNDVPVKLLRDEPTPTPVLAYLANSDPAITGVINLTASHNRYTDSGFKFSPHHGGAADTAVTDQISRYANDARVPAVPSYAAARAQGGIQEVSLQDAVARYVDGYVVPTLQRLTAWATITAYVRSAEAFRLILDPMQGAAVRYVAAIYRAMERAAGCRFVELIHADNRDPTFAEVNGAPNPTERENVHALVTRVARDGHTLGLATDGDADRFGVVDFGGRVISANAIIAMLAYFLADRGLTGAIGKTVATSNFVNAVAAHLGAELIETPVGFKWFVERTVKDGTQFLVAGEESAHVGVQPFMTSWDDSIALGALCLWMVADTGKSLTAYQRRVEAAIGRRFHYRRYSVALTPALKARASDMLRTARREDAAARPLSTRTLSDRVNALGATQPLAAIVTLDGVKLVFDTGDWLGIRLSGTENVARLYVETTDPARQAALRGVGEALLAPPAPRP
jgi:phosphomannomutase